MLIIAVPLEGVTVKPLCPTNKIAPHRRVVSVDRYRPRTFGAFYDLFYDTVNDTQSSLQERPQEDDPNDCGEIEDYDENDLGALTPQSQRRQAYDKNRFFFGGLLNRPSNDGQNQYPSRPQVPSARPPRPLRPTYPPTRPPYWSGGYFGNNPYRPPLQQYPSDNIKPVHEHLQEPPVATYRPGVVGGALGHVVGISQVRPTNYPPVDTTTGRVPVRFPQRSTKVPDSVFVNRRPTSKPRQYNSNNSIVGSFIDLLFK